MMLFWLAVALGWTTFSAASGEGKTEGGLGFKVAGLFGLFVLDMRALIAGWNDEERVLCSMREWVLEMTNGW